MHLNKDFILRKIAGEVVLVPTGDSSTVFNGLITMNEVAQFIWENIDNSKDEEEVLKKVLDEFEIDEETARTDVYGFIKEAKMVGMILD